VIVNPVAGMGRAHELEPRIQAALRHGDVRARVLETREPGHAEQLAAAAADLGHDRVVAVGGDGTVQEVINGLMRGGAPAAPPPTLGVVPAGSGNDLARSLELPLAPLDALPVAMGQRTRSLDLGLAASNGAQRYFHAAGGTGFDAEVAFTMAGRRSGWQRGRAGYFLSTLNELRRYRNRELRIRLATPNGARELEGRFLFVAFANGPYYGGGMKICPDASNQDGLLDVCLVGDISRLGALRELPGIYRAAHVNHPLVELVRVLEMRIEGQPGTRVHLDGEPMGGLPVDVRVRPAALQVAVLG
jgi:YegS/Rv2252/BmrU family lipid kinase